MCQCPLTFTDHNQGGQEGQEGAVGVQEGGEEGTGGVQESVVSDGGNACWATTVERGTDGANEETAQQVGQESD